jgi:3-oxoacyl-[acyl-carrier protein] reductase
MMQLDKKVVFISGAARNLGRAMALACADAGADVAIHYRSSADAAHELVAEIEAMGRRAFAVAADVGDYAQFDAAVSACVQRFGRVDVLVNNAGVLLRSMLMMMSPQDFETVIRANLLGTFHGMKAVSRHMIKQRGGVIINVSSAAGERGMIGQGAYSASKGGVNSLTGVGAKELARYGVRVNGIAPGAINTGMISALPEDFQDKYVRDIPLGRYGEADEVARVVVFLASSAASYLTGQTITVDGGLLC